MVAGVASDFINELRLGRRHALNSGTFDAITSRLVERAPGSKAGVADDHTSDRENMRISAVVTATGQQRPFSLVAASSNSRLYWCVTAKVTTDGLQSRTR